MRHTAMISAGLLVLGTCAAWAQSAPSFQGEPDGSAAMNGDQGSGARPDARALPSASAGGPDSPAAMGPGQERGGDFGATHWQGPGGAVSPAMRELSLTEAQEKELRTFVKANDAHMDENLTADKANRPMVYRHQLAGLWSMYMLPAGRERWVKQAKSRRELTDLLAQYKSVPDDQKPAIKEKLAKSVGDLFESDLEEKGNQVLSLEAEAAHLKDRIAKRREAKDKIVAQRVEKLTSEGDDWPW